MQNNEADWWQNPAPNLLPILHKARNLSVDLLDKIGTVVEMRFNLLHPPFNNLKLRQAIMPAIDQSDFMQAGNGTETSLFALKVGVFTPRLAAGQHRGPRCADGNAGFCGGEKAGGRKWLQGRARGFPDAHGLPNFERLQPGWRGSADPARYQCRSPGDGSG